MNSTNTLIEVLHGDNMVNLYIREYDAKMRREVVMVLTFTKAEAGNLAKELLASVNAKV